MRAPGAARPPSRPPRRALGWAVWAAVLGSPLVVLALLRHARLIRDARGRATRFLLSLALPLLRAALRALGVHDAASALDPNARTIEDPDLPVWFAGVTSLGDAERRAGKALWEWWLDALRFDPDSAGRAHIRQLLKHPTTIEKFEALFAALGPDERGVLDADAVVRFSAGISGTARVLLEHKEYVNKEYARGRRANTKAADASDSSVIELPAATPAEHDFLLRNHDLLFPPRHPLDRDAFLSLAKLVFVRRIVKALVSRRGLRAVQRGMRAPLVVDVAVADVRRRARGDANEEDDDDGDGSGGGGKGEAPPRILFRIHTVAPSTAPGADGHRLGAISEG
jgi:hypothetical protein